ncbi:MAG: aminopeptidase [Nanoarchaeota archaeon]|nr:aminopeptidase [Nanoarchaeota archaeon]MBU1030224.1 aminopeptidase [Nanoarchaeota archaeon]MBU1849122.1 aminopeptidase [Nanoarchaeota archaeon]
MIQQFKTAIDIKVFKNILRTCLDVGSEKVLIVGDYGTKNNLLSPLLANAYALAARELELNYSVVMQHSKAREDAADEILVASLKKLPDRSSIILNVSNRIGSLAGLGKSFRKFCHDHNHKFLTSSSLGSLPSDDVKYVLKSLSVDYKAMSRNAERIKNILDGASEIWVYTKAGTDISYNVEGFKAVVNTGIYNKFGMGGNLPAGEVYIPPNKTKVNGSIVIDGSLRLKNKTMLVNNSVKLEVKNGEIIKFSAGYESRLLKETIEWAHARSKHPWGVRRIGEFGIGINPNAQLIGATVVDEKMLGTAHFAIGSNAWFGGTIYSIIHLDQVFKNPIIKVDGRFLRV